MNDQVRTLNEGSYSSSPLKTPRVASDSVATNHLLAQLGTLSLLSPATRTCSREAISGGWGERMRLTTGAELTCRPDPTSEHLLATAADVSLSEEILACGDEAEIVP